MRIVVVGVGRWGRIHCEKVAKSNWSTLVAVVDIDIARARAAGEDFGVHYSTSWSDELQADLVILAAPGQRIADLVAVACAKGISFLAEKPVTVGIDEWRHLAALRERADVLGAVGYQMRFHPRLHELKGTRSLTIAREESGFDDVWSLVCDCGVHDLDLALFIAGPLQRVNEVKLTDTRLEVEAVSVHGGKLRWCWSLGDKLVRTITGDSHCSIDLRAPSGDLISSQWRPLVKQSMVTHQP